VDRDEYGHLTLEAQCRFLAEAERDPGWPLRDPTDDTTGSAGLGFRTARDLCDAMTQGLTHSSLFLRFTVLSLKQVARIPVSCLTCNLST
jgi:hypothetical protein